MSRRQAHSSPSLRWIDLGIAWFRQYALAGSSAEDAPAALDEIAGYLDATAAAFLTIDADLPADLEHRARLAAIHDLISRAEAEFCGRVFMSAPDLGRWLDDPSSLTWAMLCLGRPLPEATLEDVASLVRRGVRILALPPGAHLPEQLDSTVIGVPDGDPRLGLDLSRLDELEIRMVLDRLESTAARSLPLLREAPAATIARLPDETLGRIASAGGVIGVALKGSPLAETRAALERLVALGGSDGVGRTAALASGLLSGPPAEPGLASAGQLTETLGTWFDKPTARGVVRSHAEEFLTRLLGPPVRTSASETRLDSASPMSRGDRPAY
jgi:hypothetical protein